jgi:hypothetical protein
MDVGYHYLSEPNYWNDTNFNNYKIGVNFKFPLFLRKEIFDHYGKFDPSYEIAGDFDFIARIFKSNTLKYRYLEEIFVMMQSGGVSTQGLKSTIILNKEIMLSCKKNGIKTSWITLLSRYPYKLMEFFKLKASQ